MQNFKNADDQVWAEAMDYLGIRYTYRINRFKLQNEIYFKPDFTLYFLATVIVVMSKSPSSSLFEIEEFHRKYPNVLVIMGKEMGRFNALHEKEDNTYIRRCNACGRVYFSVGNFNKCPICGRDESIIVINGNNQVPIIR